MSKKSNVEGIIDQINASNTKKLAVLLVVGFILYHGFLHFNYGSDSCKWLLSNGRYKADKEWQPFGCMLHRYSQIDTKRCLRYLAFYEINSTFIFIGDSRIKQLYLGFVGHLQKKGGSCHLEAQNISNLTHIDKTLKLKVQFLWSPSISLELMNTYREWRNNKNNHLVLITGTPISIIKNFNKTTDIIETYIYNLTSLIKNLNQIQKSKTTVLWYLQPPVNWKLLSPDQKATITNEKINIFNQASLEVLKYSQVNVWHSSYLVAESLMEQSRDGLHLPYKALNHAEQILINMYCNDHMNFNDGTCCSSAESSTTLQIVTFTFFGLCMIVAMVMTALRIIKSWRGEMTTEYMLLRDAESPPLYIPSGDYYTLFISLAEIGLIMGYFFLCDRTNFFMKENKYYSEFSFWLPIGYIFILGLFFTEDSKFTKVLHKDQIHEWKGWMQLVVLVYQVTGANQILPINMHIKVMTSAYLFLMAYQQFYYVWQTNGVSLVGFFTTLFQINFTTFTLCLCMNRPYQFYNFVPLISFWFMMVYLFLSLPPVITAQSSDNNPIQYLYLVIKFSIFFSVVTILFMSEVFFEKVFVTRPWKALFVTTDDDIHEWWSRWKLDRFSPLYGMFFATFYLLAQKYCFFDDNNHNNLFSRGIALTTTLAAMIGVGIYVAFTFLCSTELDCNEIHSYIVFIPIVGYVILRNISGMLRTRYSSFFAWFGNIYLELYVSQYHIWLAADTHGVLVLVPGYPMLNIIITSFIYVCASHEMHRLTKVLIPYAVPTDWRPLLKNVILFLAVLVPIGINDGMF